MAKRLKTLNLCDASVERLKKTHGQSAFARQAILGYDRLRQDKWDLQRELDQQNALLEMNRQNYAILVQALLEAYGNGWTVEGLLIEFMGKEQWEVAEIHNDGYLRTALRTATNHRALNGGD